MESFWPLLLLAVVVGVVWRLGAARRKAVGATRPTHRMERRIQGFKVLAALYPQLGRGCLFDHGMQYGEGFRNKDGPMLPHDGHCQCETVPFVFSSSEVFGGALRQFGTPRCLVPDFPPQAVKPVLEALKRVNAEVIPEQAEQYYSLVNLEHFPLAVQPAVQSLLWERHTFLLQLQRAQLPRPAESAPQTLTAPQTQLAEQDAPPAGPAPQAEPEPQANTVPDVAAALKTT